MLSILEVAKRQRLFQLERCPECGSEELVTDRDRGEVVCDKCGLVIRDLMLDKGPEWRAFTHEEKEDRRRVGTPTSLSFHDKGLSTVIGRVNRDAFGRELPSAMRLQMLRLRKWHIRARVHSSVDRNLSQAMAELKRLADKLHISKEVEEEAALIYRKVLREGLVRGRSILSIVAASLYAACRLTRTPRNLKNIVEASTRNWKEVARCYRLIQRNLNMKMPIDDPVKYVPKIGSKAGLDQQTQNRAIEILREAEKSKATVGKGPAGVAAAALYIATLSNVEKTTQKRLSIAAEVTEVTVRNRYKRLVEDLGLRVDP